MGDVRNVLGGARKRDPTSEKPETERAQGKRPETELEPAERAPEQQLETDPKLENVAAGTAPREQSEEKPVVRQTRV